MKIEVTEKEFYMILESLNYHYDMTDCQKEDKENKELIKKLEKQRGDQV